MSRAKIITLGCRLNLYESEIMSQLAQRHRLHDVIIINSCAVTQAAQSQTRQKVRRARRQYPTKRILLTGCAPEIAPGDFQSMSEVDAIIKNRDKTSQAVFRALAGGAKSAKESSGENSNVNVKQARTRALLKVQDGCDWQCTFCVIPQGRGASRSRAADAVIREANDLFAVGHQEITLTGVDITSYGRDLSPPIALGNLVEKILRATPTSLKLRLTSLDPAAMDGALLALLATEERLQPHIHLSVQSGDNMILKRMRRRHCREDVIALSENLRKTRALSIGADLIAGFPTETSAMCAQSAALIDQCDIVFAHIFPFSPRPGTAAARMPQNAPQIIRQRAARLRQRAETRLKAFLDGQIGSIQPVLAETSHTGRTPSYAPVRWHGAALQAGGIYSMAVKERLDNTLIAALHPANS